MRASSRHTKICGQAAGGSDAASSDISQASTPSGAFAISGRNFVAKIFCISIKMLWRILKVQKESHHIMVELGRRRVLPYQPAVHKGFRHVEQRLE